MWDTSIKSCLLQATNIVLAFKLSQLHYNTCVFTNTAYREKAFEYYIKDKAREIKIDREEEKKVEKVVEPSRSPGKDPLDQSSPTPSKKVPMSFSSYRLLAGSVAVVNNTQTHKGKIVHCTHQGPRAGPYN